MLCCVGDDGVVEGDDFEEFEVDEVLMGNRLT